MTDTTNTITPAATVPTTDAPAQSEPRVAAEAPKAEDGGQRRRQRGGKGRRRNGNPQAAARPQQHRGPREKATIAGRLALAQADGDQERVGRLIELAEWKTYLEAIVASESRSAIAQAVRDLRDRFADEIAAQRAYRDANGALNAAVAKRDERLADLHVGDNPPNAEEMGQFAKAVREAEAKWGEAVRLVRENSVGLDLYYELLRVLPPPPARGDRQQYEARGNADHPRGNGGPRHGNGRRDDRTRKGEAAPVNGGLSAGREQRNRERIAREAQAAEARRKAKADNAQRIAEAEAVAAFLRWSAVPTAIETSRGPAVERLQIEGLGGLKSGGVFHMPDDPAPAISAQLS